MSAQWLESATGFVPVAVERPGGGRIADKRDPAPADVVVVRGYRGRRIPLHRLAAAAWTAMVAEARAAGISAPLLLPNSGYRSSARQRRLFAAAVRRYGSRAAARRWVAAPGGSAHQSGRAIDLFLGGTNDSANVARLRTTPAYRWLLANAARFGFYPYDNEPWHWEYNPPATGRESEFAAPAVGLLVAQSPGGPALRYRLSADDALWTARFIRGEAGGRDDAGNRAVVWAMLNRYAFFTHPQSHFGRRARNLYPTFGAFLRAYSTTLQPYLRSAGAVERSKRYARENPSRFRWVPLGGTFRRQGREIERGQLAHHLRLQQMPWMAPELAASRRLATAVLSGARANPIGLASEFADTAAYYRQRHGVRPTTAQWEAFTREHARRNRWTWIGPRADLPQLGKNAFFVDNRLVALSRRGPTSVRVLPDR